MMTMTIPESLGEALLVDRYNRSNQIARRGAKAPRRAIYFIYITCRCEEGALPDEAISSLKWGLLWASGLAMT